MNKLRSKLILIAARVVVRQLIKLHGYENVLSNTNITLINIWVYDEDKDDSEIEVEKIKKGISYKGKINLPNR